MRDISFFPTRALLLAGLAGLLYGTVACEARRTAAATQLRRLLIDEALMRGNDELLRLNRQRVRAIEAQTRRNHNRAADTLVLHQAQAAHDSTQALVTRLREVRDELLRRTDNQAGFRQLDGRREVAALLPAAPASQLYRRLTGYTRYLHQLAPAAPASAAALPALDFAGATVAEALTTLAQGETQLLLRETAALQALRAKVDDVTLQTIYQPLAVAENNVVAPGETYQASLLLARSLYQPGRLTMRVDGRPVPVGPNGYGWVTLTAPALQGAARRRLTWTGSITVQRPGQRDSTFFVTVPYTVIRRD